MKKLFIKKGINIAWFFFIFIILQIVQFSWIFNFPFPDYFFLDYFCILALACLVFLVHNTVFDRIFLGILEFAVAFFVVANITFYQNFDSIFSLYNFGLSTQGIRVAFTNPSYYNFGLIGVVLAIYAVFLTALIIFNMKYKVDTCKDLLLKKLTDDKTPKKEMKRRYVSMAASLVVLIGSFATSNQVLDVNLGVITIQKNANMEKYGTLTYYLKEIDYLINGGHDLDDKDIIQYFGKNTDINSNYTGLLKGKNVFVIMIETGDSLMVNEALTPNMYSLTQNSIYCNNNHSKNKTNISEFIGITGVAPSAGIQANKYEYHLPFSLPNMLGDDYTTMYFHDVGTIFGNDTDIYSRAELMPKLNFDESYFHEELYSPDTPIWGWGGDYSLDSVTMDTVADEVLKHDEPFMAFYTSLTMHGPYVHPYNESRLERMYGDKLERAKEDGSYVNPLEGTVNEKAFDNYMMAAMDFDKGLGKVFSKFEEAGKLDDTLFVVYGDHDLYYVGEDGISLDLTLAGTDDLAYCPFNTTLFFYNPELTDVYKRRNGTNAFSIYTSPYNIVPTVLDLLGIDYNSNFYLSPSIFSDEMNEEMQIFYSIELSAFLNEYYYSTDGNFVDFVFDPDYHHEKEFLEAVHKVLEKQTYLESILTTDYFSTHDFDLYM